ncbi:MAG: hypothetical protein J5822_02000 [Eubacteriaceae bacterium]|nr:hypothetical protein [Eubacteriaceae bacterium]
MELTLNAVRIFISPDEEFFERFSRISDTPLVNVRGEGSMFSKICPDRASFDGLLSTVGIPDEYASVLGDAYDSAASQGSGAAVFFSDERSGSNRIELRSAHIEDGELLVEMERRRGLTMDMAYTFFFLGLPEAASRVAKASVTDSAEEAGIFF